MPAPVKKNGFVEKSVNLGWKGYYPADELGRLLDGISVKCGNDANVAALGEMWKGGGEGYSDIVLVTLGTGVGSGVIIDQKIHTGYHGLAGEMGHIHVNDEETECCNCGSRGCLEQYASATGIVRLARGRLASDGRSSLMRDKGDKITAKDVVDAAKAGDETAGEVMELFGHYLGMALSQAALIVDPEVFVIGGGVSNAGQYLIDLITRHYKGYVKVSEDNPKIVLATLGNDAGIYGAARMVLD